MEVLRRLVEEVLSESGVDEYRILPEEDSVSVLAKVNPSIMDRIISLAKDRGLRVVYSEPIPDYHAWRQEVRRQDVYVPDDLNEIADNLWKLRDDIDEWKLVVDVPQEVVDLLLLGDRREIYFQLKKWGWDRRLEVVYFMEWFENYYGQLNFWRSAIERMGASPFGNRYLIKFYHEASETAQG